MPIDSHLEWNEIRDFTPGLWDVGNQFMPANAAQTMTDCHASPAGGLRAWHKRQTFTTSGVVNTTNEKVRGLWVNERLTNRSGSGQNNDYWMLTYDTVSTVCRLYRMDQTAAGPPTTWSVVKTFAAGLDPGLIKFTNYYNAANLQHIVLSLGFGGGADVGVWYFDYTTATPVKLTATPGSVYNYQSRLIVTSGSSIFFTDPGAFTNIATNVAVIDQNEGHANGILEVATFSPGDLLVFKAAAPIYLVEGDLTNFTVRQMNGSKFMADSGGSNCVRGPMGVIFRVGHDGIYETPDGSQIMPMSKNLASTHFDQANYLNWVTHYLLDHVSGLVFDYDTKTWFTTSMQPGGVGTPLARTGQFMLADNSTAAFTLWTISADDTTGHRAESYTWKSAPIRHETGRQIEIRAVEVYARSFNGATSSVTVTVNGAAQTVNCDTTRGAMMFYFKQRGEYLDVQVDSASNASTVEAPIIETIRIGSQGGHFLKP